MAFMDYMPQFGNNTAPMQETALPQDDTLMQLDLKRKLALADALRQQQMPEGQMVSGRYVAPSWTQYLANAVNKYSAGQQEKQALGQFGEYQKTKQQKMREEALKLGKALDPKAITEDSTFDVQVSNNKTPTPTDNLGGMQPYESGMKTVSTPVTNTIGYRQPTQAEIYNAIGEYSAGTGNNDLLEKSILGRINKKLEGGGKYSIHNVGNVGLELDESGKPTGKRYDFSENKPTDYGTAQNAGAKALFGKDFGELSQPEQRQVVDYVNQYKAGQLGVAQGNLGVNRQQANFATGVPSTNQPQAKTTSVAEIQDYARKNGISYGAAAQHANRLGYTVQ
jgi:hypothetical protein